MLTNLMDLILEPSYPRGYVGRHRAPEVTAPTPAPARAVVHVPAHRRTADLAVMVADETVKSGPLRAQ